MVGLKKWSPVLALFLSGCFGLGRLNFDPPQSVAPAIRTKFSSLFNGEIHAIAISGDDGYFGGAFSHYNPIQANSLVRVDPTTGEQAPGCSLAGALNPGARVFAAVKSEDQKYLFVGGKFTSFRGKPVNGLIKIDLLTCNLVPDFSSEGVSLSPGSPGYIFALAIQGDALYVGGRFALYQGQAVSHLIKVSASTGGLQPNADAGSFFKEISNIHGNHPQVRTLLIEGNSLFVGGSFAEYGETPVNHIAKINLETGNLETSFHPSGETQGVGHSSGIPEVSSLAIAGDRLFIGGDFTSYRGSEAKGLVQVDKSGGAFSRAIEAPYGPETPSIHTLTLAGSVLYAGGATYSSTSAVRPLLLRAPLGESSNLTKINLDTSTGVISNLTAIQNRLYAVGTFQIPTDAQEPIHKLAQFSLDSDSASLDPPASRKLKGTSLDSDPALLVQIDSTLILAGAFRTYGGLRANRLAKVHLPSQKLDLSFSPQGQAENPSPNGTDQAVRALALHHDTLYAGGDFTHYRGRFASNIVKLNATSGDQQEGFAPAFRNGTEPAKVHALAYSPQNDSLYVGGEFSDHWIGGGTHQQTNSASNFIRLHPGTGGILQYEGCGVNGPVYSLLILGTKLYVGGGFSTFCGFSSSDTNGRKDLLLKITLSQDQATSDSHNQRFTFASGTATASVRAIAPSIDQKSIYVVGKFSQTGIGASPSTPSIGVIQIDVHSGDRIMDFNPSFVSSETENPFTSVATTADSVVIARETSTPEMLFYRLDSKTGALKNTCSIPTLSSSSKNPNLTLYKNELLISGSFQTPGSMRLMSCELPLSSECGCNP